MFLLDSLLVGGLRFVLDKVATVVDAELNDDTALHAQLMEAQMRLELGEMSQAEFDTFEADVLVRIREIRTRRQEGEPAAVAGADYKITGIDASFEGDEH